MYLRFTLYQAEPRVSKEMLKNRGEEAPLDELLELDEQRRALLTEIEQLKAKRNAVSDQVAKLKREKQDASALIEEMKVVSQTIKEYDEQLRVIDEQLRDRQLRIPNIPMSRCMLALVRKITRRFGGGVNRRVSVSSRNRTGI